MSQENKSSEQQETTTGAGKKENSAGSKPVIIYIMILFIAAFLLMALSFLMHQRSNTEALGDLQNSVNAMQEVQSYQDKIIELQEKLADAEDALDAQQKETQAVLDKQAAALSQQTESLDAMTELYCLQQAYSRKNYEQCQAIIQRMETSGAVEMLPKEISESGDITTPYDRFSQFKEAISAISALGD